MLTPRVCLSILVSATLHSQEAYPGAARGLGAGWTRLPDALDSVVGGRVQRFQPAWFGQNSLLQAANLGGAGTEIRLEAR